MTFKPRSAVEYVNGTPDEVGQGFMIQRTLPMNREKGLSPFLLLDHMGPITGVPGNKIGVGDHPHRGFETVTLVIDGAVEHRDSAGNHGVITAGGIQWMTAASGIIHSEFVPQDWVDQSAKLQFIQLWVNLPKKHKKDFPRYQDLNAGDIITINLSEGCRVRLYAGQFASQRSKVMTHSPLLLMTVHLSPGEKIDIPLAKNFTSFAHVIEGQADFLDKNTRSKSVSSHITVIFDRIGDGIQIENKSQNEDTLVLIGGGEAIDEPIVFGGPFVMNTPNEIRQAVMDYQSGNFIRKK